MKFRYLIIVICALIGLNGYWIFDKFKDNRDFNKQRQIHNIKENALIEQIIHLNDYYYGKYSELCLIKGSEIDDLLDNEKLVLNFGEGNCYGCLIEPLNYIENLAKSIGSTRIIINGYFKNPEDYTSFRVQISALVGDYHFTNTKCLPNDLENEFAIFIVDSSLKIKYLLLPELQSTFQQKYFSSFLPMHFNK